jgi:Fur family ferric uptake transcriptional regulator
MAAAHPSLSTDDARQHIREAGLRATPGRIAVLQAVYGQPRPITHAELVEKLSEQGSDASTIFRALNDMSDAGLLRRLELGDHVWRYELAATREPSSDAHPHFLCLDCGEITCLEPLDMRPITRENRELKKVGKVTEVLLKGSCSQCQETQ